MLHGGVTLLLTCCFAVNSASAAMAQPLQRRAVVAGAAASAASLSTGAAEAGWRAAVAAAAAAGDENMLLPPGTIEQIESGRIVIIPNWLPADELSALRADAEASYAAGHFKADALATYGQKNKAGTNQGFDPANDRMVMPSFYPSKGTDGPWVDMSIGDGAARQRFKSRMAQVKALLARKLEDRPSLADDAYQTHEMSYTRYGPGASLPRHTDEHHGELKKAHPVASGDENLKRLTALSSTSTASGPPSSPRKPKATRRSVTWLVYLNDDWDAARDGGELRVHERANPASARVGARGADLQIGWLKATKARPEEQPVFLDARRPGEANCCLYACSADGTQRDLSRKPFAASPALYLSGGDFFARKLLIDDPEDAARFHLIDAPKSAASALMPSPGPAGEDGGERVRDVAPNGGTLVLFDSVSLPHEVMPTRGRERFACSGWFHEKLYG